MHESAAGHNEGKKQAEKSGAKNDGPRDPQILVVLHFLKESFLLYAGNNLRKSA
jgi:hypothetical protein